MLIKLADGPMFDPLKKQKVEQVIENLYSKATCTGATKIIQKNRETYDLQTR